MGIDSAFLRRENKLLEMTVNCGTCGNEIKLFINHIASPGEVWPFCEKCQTYVDVKPGDET